jgi:hypothetical protein
VTVCLSGVTGIAVVAWACIVTIPSSAATVKIELFITICPVVEFFYALMKEFNLPFTY